MVPDARIKILEKIKSNIEFHLSRLDKSKTEEIHMGSNEIQALSEAIEDVRKLDNIKESLK